MRTPLMIGTVAALVTIGAAVALPGHPAAPPPPQTVLTSRADPVAVAITAAQTRLRRLPGDWVTWAELGLTYVERARTTADPSYYPKAQGALAESLHRHPTGNALALTGLGALANARHDFTRARDLARAALAADPYSSQAMGVLADALTQLGRADEATAAVQRMLDTRPGLPAYARAAYDLEQHGRLEQARDLYVRALTDAHTPTDVAYLHVQLGDLAWHGGDRHAARAHYDLALAADPGNLQARAGLARATGDLALWAAVTAQLPSPSLLIEEADQLRSAGRTASADEQLALASAALRLFAASGGQDDLGQAELALAQGAYGDAVAAARREWARRHHADVAAVLAWALYLSGDSRSALPYAQASLALGSRNRIHLAHLREITADLGWSAPVRRYPS